MKKKLLTGFLIFVASLFSIQSRGQCPDSTSNSYQRGDFGNNNTLHYELASGCAGSTLTISGTGALNQLPMKESLTGQSNIIVKDGVTSIGDSLFTNWSCNSPGGILWFSLSIANSVTSVGNYAFYGFCAPYLGFTPPSNLTNIGNYAFARCSSQEYPLYLPNLNSLKSIGDFAFLGYGGSGSPGAVNLPSSVASIGMGAFSECPLINSINVANDNVNYSSEDGVLFNKNKTVLLACLSSKSGIYTIPSSVTTIGGTAFLGSNVTSITIPSSVQVLVIIPLLFHFLLQYCHIHELLVALLVVPV